MHTGPLRALDHFGAAAALAPALLVCLRLAVVAGAAIELELGDRDTMLPTGPIRVLVTESTGEDDGSAEEKEPLAEEAEDAPGLPVTPSGVPSNGTLSRLNPRGSLCPLPPTLMNS